MDDTKGNSTWNRFKHAVARGDKFQMEYKMSNGTSISRTIQRLPPPGPDGVISAAQLTKRYADLKSLLVDGGMFDPTLRTAAEAIRSDNWDDMFVDDRYVESVTIHRWVPVVAGGARNISIMHDRTPAFWPFLIHEDVPYDLTHLQMYRARDARPVNEQTCMIHAITEGAKDLKIPIDGKVMAGVILRYVQGGAGNVSTKHLSDIAVALKIRFEIAAERSRGKQGTKKHIVTEIRPKTASSNRWPIIPLGLRYSHIFYNKNLPPCSEETIIIDDCKNNFKTAASKGLKPRKPIRKDQQAQVKERSTLWLLIRLEKYGYINREIIDPRVICDQPDRSLKLFSIEDRLEHKIANEKLLFDQIVWPQESVPRPIEFKITEGEKRQKKPPASYVMPTVMNHEKKGKENGVAKFLKEIEHVYTFYYGADSEATTKGAHELYLFGYASLAGGDVEITPDVGVALHNIAESRQTELDFVKTKLSEFKKPAEQKLWATLKARIAGCSKRLDNVHLIRIVIYMHNLRYDRAVLERYLLIYSVLERDNQIYEFHTKLAAFPEILFIFRDSSKHLTGMSVDQMPKKMGLPAYLNKKQKGIYYDYFAEERRGLQSTIRDYITFRPNKSQTDQEALVIVNEMLCDFHNYIEDPSPFEPLSLDEKFSPDIVFQWYLEFDVMVLVAALNSYEDAFNAVRRDYLQVHPPFRPLHYPTISSYSRALLGAAGAFESCVKYGLGLRAYIQRACRGGRTNCHSEFEGKIVEIDGGIDDLDGVSLYPSAIASLPGFPCFAPDPIPDEHLSINAIHEHAHTAVVTVRITAINRKLKYIQPIIAWKNDEGVLEFIQDLPNNQPLVDTLHIIDLEEYIRLHQIDYEILYGVYWKKKPCVPKTSYCGEQKVVSWGESVREIEPNSAWPKFAVKLHEARKAAKEMFKNTGDVKYEVQANMLKLTGNSGYGGSMLRISNKCVNVRVKDSYSDTLQEDDEDEEKEEGSSRTDTYLYNNHGTIHEWRETNQNVFVTEHQNDFSTTYNIMGVMILAQSRRNLNRVLESYEACGAHQFYSDTDSIHGPRLLTNAVAAHYDSVRNPGVPPLIGKELGQFHVDFAPADFAIFPTGFLTDQVSTWPKEAKESDIFSRKLFLIRKKVYLHLLSVHYTINGEQKTAHGMKITVKGLTKKGLYRQAYLEGKAFEDGSVIDPYATEDLEYSDPTSRGILSIFKRVLAGDTVSVQLLTNNGDVRFYFNKGSVTTSAAPCARTIQLSDPIKKRNRPEDISDSSINKRICIDADDETFAPDTIFLCIDD
jgi:hypothetical protein